MNYAETQAFSLFRFQGQSISVSPLSIRTVPGSSQNASLQNDDYPVLTLYCPQAFEGPGAVRELWKECSVALETDVLSGFGAGFIRDVGMSVACTRSVLQ